jgi:hypothetical protein
MIGIYVAATVAVFISCAHSYLGERSVIPRLLRLENLPLLRRDRAFTGAILRWAWHLTSFAWLGFAFLLYAVAARITIGPVELARTIAVIFGVTGLVTFVTTRGRHIAWPFFTIVALAGWFGVR